MLRYTGPYMEKGDYEKSDKEAEKLLALDHWESCNCEKPKKKSKKKEEKVDGDNTLGSEEGV